MIDVPQVLNLLEIAVSERGEDFHYEDYAQLGDLTAGLQIDPHDCQYANPLTGQPLCIAGVVLNEAGLLGYVREGDVTSNQSGLVGKISEAALDVLDAAQQAQDTGNSWGYALGLARLRADEWEADSA